MIRKTATIDETFDEKFIREKITDTGIQQILLRHLEACGGDSKLAFSQDGIDQMNKNIVALNAGHPHKPIYKVRKYEKAEKYAVGEVGVKAKKYVEAADGTKLFTMVYEKENIDGQVVRKLVPLYLKTVVDAQKRAEKKWVEYLDQQMKDSQVVDFSFVLKFMMSPGDLVYLPTEEEEISKKYGYFVDRIYKVVSLDGENPNFIPASIATMIIDKAEFTTHNKSSRSLDGKLIKKTCIPVSVDRLGNIIS